MVLLYGLAPICEMRGCRLAEKKPKVPDLELFHREVEGVRRIKTPERTSSRKPAPPPLPRQRERDERQVLTELLDDSVAEEGLETGEELKFLRTGFQRRYLTRLTRGHYAINDHVDLHHMNVDTARKVLLDFIEHSVAAGHGCVRVVHGKGLRSRSRPRLKEMTNHVLRRHPAVIAFASCRPVDGGTGAVTILLRDRS